MKVLQFPADLDARKGKWRTTSDIKVANVARCDIYRSPLEPSYVAWAILWKERSGALKLSFVEATGDLTAWPPTYNFNSGDIAYYLKTLVSKDGGRSWKDTGWREDLDKLWIRNPDHHIRHVFELPDGTLMRNYCHTLEGRTSPGPLCAYDETKENSGVPIPFSYSQKAAIHQKSGSIWTSDTGGESWREIHVFDQDPPLFLTAIHPLKDGSIVAMGTVRPDEIDESTCAGAFTESVDGGKTWSKPIIIAANTDRLNPQGIDGECDFVELDDGRLCVIWRTCAAGSCFRQHYLARDSAGKWQASPCVINPALERSGYPYMHRTSDGTIFHYSHGSMNYSCDDGATWRKLDMGISYYGQVTEVSRGRMLAVTQKNMGDCPYPWKHDASMMQTTFDYERIGIAEQSDVACAGALATLAVGEPSDFHVALEMRLDAASGIAYQIVGDDYRFAALTIPANASRLQGGRADVPQNAFLQIGEVEGGRTTVLRKIGVGKIAPGSWLELQVSRKKDFLTVACKSSGDETFWGALGATYTCLREKDPSAGPLALFAGFSTAAFRNVRFASSPETVRDNWLVTDSNSLRIALDAGRAQ